MNFGNQPTALWDFNGVIVTIDGFWDYLKQADAALYKAWKVDSEGKPELKAKYKGRVVEVFEDATRRGLYPMEPMKDVVEALQRSIYHGRTNVIFSTMGSGFINEKLAEHKLANKIERVITLDEVIKFAGVADLVKESPTTYEQLSRYLASQGNFSLEVYVDDSRDRILAAVDANLILRQHRLPQFQRLYHFDPKQPQAGVMGYTRINDLLAIQ